MEENSLAMFNYDQNVNIILNLINKPILTAEEEKQIIDFINDYWQKYQILTNEDVVTPEIRNNMAIGRKVIQEAFKVDTPGSKIITNEFTKKLENNVNSSQYRGSSRILKNPNMPNTIPKDDQNLGMEGFTNIILIIVLTIVLGAILAAFVINR